MTNAIVICTWGAGRDGLPAGAEEIVALGAKVAALRKVDLTWLVLGELPQRTIEVAGAHGVAAVEQIEDEKLTGFTPDVWVETLAQYCAQRQPWLMLLAQTFDARLVAPRLAARAGAGVAMNAVDLDLTGDGQLRVVSSAYGGDTRVVYEVTGADSCVVGVLVDALSAGPPATNAEKPEVSSFGVDLSGVEERIRVLDPARSKGPRLEEARIIVAGGRGLGTAENYRLVEQLAEALGGMAGASRPIVDDGWVDSSRQVGLTGKITRPVLYVAAGISGATQHMVGCSGAKTLVAINSDADAPIFRYANYGIVGDCNEILPELARVVKGA